MLQAMRKGASGWLAKGLLTLLVVSFAVWGIGGDMLTSSIGSNVIEVGKTQVSLGEFQRDYQRNLNLLSGRLGIQLTQEQARQFGLAQMTINQIASRAMIEEKTRRLGLDTNEETIRTVIRGQPAFRNQFGSFDRFMFEHFLAQNGYSEADYVAIVRNNITGEQLFGSLASGLTEAPAPLRDAIFDYLGEKRSAEFIILADSSITDAPIPTDEQLQALINEKADSYSAPEYRKISYILLTPESVAAETEVSEDELQAEYEANRDQFDLPEKRAVEQMIFESEDGAKAAHEKLLAGQSFADVAMSELQLTKTDIDLGVLTREELLPELQEPVFNLEVGAVTEPVKTVLGWHVATVTRIEPGETRSFADVKEELRQEIQLRRAQQILYERATRLEDEFASGASLQDAAQTLGVQLLTTDWIDGAGRNKSGERADGLPEGRAFLVEAFGRQAGDDLEVSEMASGGYYALTVDAIEEATLRPLDEVKDKAILDWQNDWRHQENMKQAEALLERLQKGETLATIATEKGLEVQTSAPVLRNDREGEITGDALTTLFSLAPGGAGLNVSKAGNGVLLFTLKDIIPADREADQEIYAQVSERILNSLQAGIVTEYENHLQKEIGISVKEELIREYF